MAKLDGNEIGGGYYTIYCYGKSADKILEAIKPILKKSSAQSRGLYAL